MKNTWVITDLHFEHEAMAFLCDRPKNFEDRIVKHWNRLVAPSDTVICLGDICIGNDSRVHDRIVLLPGSKILVKGNHDKKSDTWYETHGWELCCDKLILERFGRRILLSHRPADVGDHYDINIHGHQHNLWPKDYTTDNKRFLLSLEHESYQPVLLHSLIQRYGKLMKAA